MRIERLPARIAIRLRTLLRRADVERDLDDEIRDHIERQTAHNIARGMTPDAARRAALVAFGGAQQVKEYSRDTWRSPMLAELSQDARHAWRVASRTPFATLIAIGTIGVAVALSAAAFTVVNDVLLRALPYPHADRLALVWGTQQGSADLEPVSYTNAMDWRRDTKSLASLAAFSCTPRPILSSGAGAERASMMEVSTDFFNVLGAAPASGRLFDSNDFDPAAAPVVVITNDLWRTRFGANPSVVSSRVLVDGTPATIAGVLAPEFEPLPASLSCKPDVYRPLDSRYDNAQRTWSFLKVVARLGPNATFQSAQAELDVVNARLAASFPESNRERGSKVVPLGTFVVEPFRAPLIVAQAGALLVLLIACANVAGLLLARASVRRRELSIRVALGASRRRLVRQIVTECALLGGAGGALGTIVAALLPHLLGRAVDNVLPDPRGLTFDWRVLAFAAATSVVATTIFALAAAAAAMGDRLELPAALRDGGRSATVGNAGLRRLVVAAQLAIATVILVCSGLLARSYRHLLDVHPGFDPAGAVTARVTLPDALYPRGERQVRFFQQVLARLTSDPGVAAAGAVSILPESFNFDRTNAKVVGRTYAPGQEPSPDVYRVTPGYFAAMRIPLLTGRLFTDGDDGDHPLVAVINEMMARQLFPNESAIGKRIWTGAGNAERTVVGVVADVHQYGLDQSRTMQLYVPHADNSGGDLTLVVRSDHNVESVRALIRDAVHAVDPGIPVDEAPTMDEVLAQSAGRRRVLAELSQSLAAVAIVLAAIGLYGVIAYAVSQRTSEIGLRMALGASARTIVASVIADTGRLVIAGLAVGLACAAAIVRLIAPLLFAVPSGDPVTFVAASLVLIAVALAASAAPTVRAARVSPMIALRED